MKFSIFPNSKKADKGQLCTGALFDEMTNTPEVIEHCKAILDAIAKGDEEKQMKHKKLLPCVTWQAYFPDGHRAASKAEPSGLYMLDIDHVEKPQKVIAEALSRREELGIVVISLTSSRHGVRLVAECRPEHNSIEEAQAWLASQMGVEYDPVCKDWARCDFRPYSMEYVYYMDYGIFERPAKAVFQKESRAFRKVRAEGELVCTMPNQRNVNEQSELIESPVTREVSRESREVSPESRDEGPEGGISNQTSFRGIALERIAREWLIQNGGEPQQGERNNQLYKLATRLRYICDFNPATLLQVMPSYGLGDLEMQQLIKSALTAARAQDMPSDLQHVIKQLVMEKAVGGDDAEEVDIEDIAALTDTSVMPPLPPVFRQWYDVAPDDFKVPAIMCNLPILGALGSKLRAKYIDGTYHSPSFQVSLEAPQASGKSFMGRIANYNLASMKEHDQQAREAERAYQEKVKEMKLLNTKVTKKDKDEVLGQRPQVLVRYVPPTMSITQMLIRMNNAKGLHLFAMAEEIDTVYKAFKRGFSSFSDALRCSFDNAEYGQDYATDTSFSGIVKLYYNTLYSGTPKAIKRFYPDSEDGTLSRTLFVTLPDQFGKKMPVWRDMTPVEEALLDANLTKLYEVSVVGDEVQPEHEMEMEFLNRKLDAWMEEQRKKSVETDDRVRNTFYRRCAEVAFRAGMLAWFLWDEKKSAQCMKKVADFSVWVAEMMLRQFVVRVQEDAQIGGVNIICRAAYNALPNQFSRQQLETTLREFGFVTQTRKVISSWKMQGCIACDKIYGSQVLSKCPNVQSIIF